MQYLLMLYVREDTWPTMPDSEKQYWEGAYRAYTEALAEAGALRGFNRLQPSAGAATVRVKEGQSQVLDGPYADSKEQLGGYYLIEAADQDAALAWAARCPAANHGTVELRAVWPTPMPAAAAASSVASSAASATA
ncbi:YciI family protein [Niveibacterium sp. SC-1]|uniref:YciI family protein n=1 Tax=Niveibacterium sp. SC-1 TaxID=3135646 RepID=UPI00311E9846